MAVMVIALILWVISENQRLVGLRRQPRQEAEAGT